MTNILPSGDGGGCTGAVIRAFACYTDGGGLRPILVGKPSSSISHTRLFIGALMRSDLDLL